MTPGALLRDREKRDEVLHNLGKPEPENINV